MPEMALRIAMLDAREVWTPRNLVASVLAVVFFSVSIGSSSGQDANWTNLDTSMGPQARGDHFMAYDTQSDRIILFGGATRIGGPSAVDGTWAYDYNTNEWRSRDPTIQPSLRFGHAMAYDAESDIVVLFGGIFRSQPETWAYGYNTNTWSNRSPSIQPPGYYLPAIAYDAESDRIILFGGQTRNDYVVTEVTNETWAYDYNTNTWTRMNPRQSPSRRAGAGMAYVAGSDRAILFGGGQGGGSDLRDTWEYDFNSDAWTQMRPSASPTARHQPGIGYSSVSDRVVLFGGNTGGSETWTYDYDNDKWERKETTMQPSPRFGMGMANDAASQRIILFGGVSHPAVFDDTWAYDVDTNAWTPLTAPSAPRNIRAAAGDEAVSLTWLPPAATGGTAITNYRIYRGTASGAASFLLDVGNVLMHLDTGVTNGITYFYEVSAVSAAGEGPRSNEVSATPGPQPDTINPTIAIDFPTHGAVVTTTSVVVTGMASDNVALEKVELSTDGATWILAAGTTSWSGSVTLQEGSNTITARATDSSGNAATTSVTVTFPPPPPPPPTLLPIIATVAGVAMAGVAAGLLIRRRRKRK